MPRGTPRLESWRCHLGQSSCDAFLLLCYEGTRVCVLLVSLTVRHRRCVFLQARRRHVRFSSGARSTLCHSDISQSLTRASHLFTPSLLHRASVSTSASARLFSCSLLFKPARQNHNFCFIFAAYLVLAGLDGSALYSWRPDAKLFAVVLRVPAARSFLSLPVSSLNTTQMLLASTEEGGSSVYHLSAVSNQSDFIPRLANTKSLRSFFVRDGEKRKMRLRSIGFLMLYIQIIQFWRVALCTW